MVILKEDLAESSYSVLISSKRNGLLLLLILKAAQKLHLKAMAHCTE